MAAQINIDDQSTYTTGIRKHPRKQTQLPIGLINGNRSVKGHIADIGPGGARIITSNYKPAVGQELMVQFRIDEYAEWGYIGANVVWTRDEEDPLLGKVTTIGLQWKEGAGFDPRWLWFLKFGYNAN